MSVSYTILPDHGIHYVRYEGHHLTAHTDRLLEDYRRDRLVTAGLRSVLDFSRILSAELDVAKRRRQMETLYGMFKDPAQDWCITYYCPSEVSRGLTEMQQKMWEARPDVDFLLTSRLEDIALKLDVPLAVVRKLVAYED